MRKTIILKAPRGKPRGIIGNISDHPHPSLSPQGRGWRKPRSKLRGFIGLAIIFMLSSIGGTARAALNPSSPFQVFWDDAPMTISAGTPFHLNVTIRAPEGYYLYADETDLDFVSLEGLFVKDIRYPRPIQYTDPYLGKTVGIFKGDTVISIEGMAPAGLEPGRKELTALLHFRGCSPSLCYRPEEDEIAFILVVEPAPQVERVEPKNPDVHAQEESTPMPRSLPEQLGLKHLLQVQDFSTLLGRGTLFALLVVFLAGVLTSLTPCVWPVIPVVLLYVGVHPHKRFLENFLLSAVMVLGIVVTYAALGIGVAAFGKNLGFLYQQRWFLALVVLFFIAMSLSMFGAFDIRMPRRLHARLHALGGEGYWGAFLAGMGLGLVASPCSGPVLAALLGYVALQGSYLVGFGLLIVYGLGMGLLMMLLGACYGELAGKLKGGAWMLWIRRALGIVLLFPAAYYMGVLFNWNPQHKAPANAARIEWVTSETDALRAAAQTGKSVMIDFTAAWCPPCGALERNFFSRNDVIGLGFELIPLRVDATSETKDVRQLIARYRVAGWPTVLFVGPDGTVYEDLRVSDYDPPAIERNMREAIKRAHASDMPGIRSERATEKR